MDKYAVMGNPIAHSKSPQIHRLFAEQTQQDMSYEKILVPLDDFEAAVLEFRQRGGKGLNITVPFKEQAWRYAERKSDQAQLAGAVNTLVFTENECFGENTDGIGLVKDISDNHRADLSNKNILILGAGGAARGVLKPLLDQKPNKVCIANRTVAKAEALVKLFADSGPLCCCGYDDLGKESFDWIINATSASLNNELPPIAPEVIDQHSQCYDMMYGPGTTAFNQWALARGANRAIDGLGMLVEQAAQSFYLWRGIMPDTGAVIKRLKNEIRS